MILLSFFLFLLCLGVCFLQSLKINKIEKSHEERARIVDGSFESMRKNINNITATFSDHLVKHNLILENLDDLNKIIHEYIDKDATSTCECNCCNCNDDTKDDCETPKVEKKVEVSPKKKSAKKDSQKKDSAKKTAKSDTKKQSRKSKEK